MIIEDNILKKVEESDIIDGTFTIPDNVTHIGKGAFDSCRGLTQITMPDSVIHIGGWVFYGCTGLAHIFIGTSN